MNKDNVNSVLDRFKLIGETKKKLYTKKNRNKLIFELSEYLNANMIAKATGIPAHIVEKTLREKGIEPDRENKHPVLIWIPRKLYGTVDAVTLEYKEKNK